MPLSSSNAVKQLSDGNTIGTVFGQSTSDVLRFYGAFGNTSGIAQLSIIGAGLGVASTAAVNATSGGGGTTWSFASSTQANQVISTMTFLWQLGLIG